MKHQEYGQEEQSKADKLHVLRFDNIVADEKTSVLRKYQELVLGQGSLWELARYELTFSLLSPVPGALGILLRTLLCRGLFRRIGKGVIIGAHTTIRHPSKISIGGKTIIDDYAVLSARGFERAHIHIGRNVLIGRGAHLRVREGSIDVGDASHIGPFSFVGTTQTINIGEHVLVAALCYIGGITKRMDDLDTPIASQGIQEKGGVVIEDDVLLGSHVIVNDGVRIGKGSFIGAGAVVTKDIPAYSIAYGVPARVVSQRDKTRE